MVPCGVAGRETDLQVTDRRPTETTGRRQRLHDRGDLAAVQTGEYAGVDEMRQRHASARSSSNDRAIVVGGAVVPHHADYDGAVAALSEW